MLKLSENRHSSSGGVAKPVLLPPSVLGGCTIATGVVGFIPPFSSSSSGFSPLEVDCLFSEPSGCSPSFSFSASSAIGCCPTAFNGGGWPTQDSHFVSAFFLGNIMIFIGEDASGRRGRRQCSVPFQEPSVPVILNPRCSNLHQVQFNLNLSSTFKAFQLWDWMSFATR